jgi:hypothetical protein
MTTRENVMLGRMFGSDPVSPSHAAREADQLLERVGPLTSLISVENGRLEFRVAEMFGAVPVIVRL